MIVLDTHAVVWWTILAASLSRRAAVAIADAERLYVPSIVFWEVALLARKRRLARALGAPVVTKDRLIRRRRLVPTVW